MLNVPLLTELSRQRQRDVAREVALCRHALGPRIILGRTLIAVGAFIVFAGAKLDQESERKPQITVV